MAREHWSCWEESSEVEYSDPPTETTTTEETTAECGGCTGKPVIPLYAPKIDEIMIIPHTIVEIHIMRS